MVEFLQQWLKSWNTVTLFGSGAEPYIENNCTDERVIDYWEWWSHHVCRRVLHLFFLRCRFQGEGQGKKQSQLYPYFKFTWKDELHIMSKSGIVQWQAIIYIAEAGIEYRQNICRKSHGPLKYGTFISTYCNNNFICKQSKQYKQLRWT